MHNQTHGDLLASRDSVRQLTLTILRCPNLKPPVAGGASDSTAAVTKVCVELLTPFGRELFHLAKAVPGLLDSILEAVGEAAGMAGTTQTSPETSKVILLNIMALLCSAKPPAAASPIQRPQIAAPVAEEMHELHQRGLVTPIIFLFDRLASSFVALDSPRLVGAFLKALEPDDFTAITRILLKSAERVSSKSNSVEGLSANEVTYMEYVLSLTIALEPMRRQEHVAGVRDRLMQHLFEIFFNVRRFGSVVAAIPEDTAAPARPGTFFGLELSETHPLRRFVANMSEFCSTDPRVATPHRGGMTHHFHDADDFLFARERLYHGTPATDPTSLTHILEQTQRMLSHGPSSMPYEILCEIHMRLHVCEAMLKTQGVTVSMTTSAHHHCRALNTIADSIRLRYSSTPFIDAEERRVVVNIVGLVCSIAKLLAGSPRGMPRDVERRRPLVQLVTFVFESWLQMAPPTKKVMLSTIELMANMGRDLFLNGSGGGGVSGSSSRPPPWQGDSWDDPGIMDQFDRPLHVDQFARRSAEMRSLAEMRSPLETFDSERRPARVMARDIRRARDASVAADSPRGGPMSPPDPSSPVNAAARLANNALQWMAVALCHQSQMDYTEEEKRQLNIHSSRIVFACWGAMARNGKREVVRFVVEKFLEDAGKYYPLLDPLAVALSQQRTQHVRSAIARRTTLPDLLVDESCRCLDRLKEFHNAAAAGCDGDAAETRQIPADLRQSTEGTIAAAVRFLSCLSVHKDPRAQGGPTRPCEHFQNGFCWNGNACGMAHIENPSARTSSDGADKEVADEISAVLVASGFPEPPAADPSDSSFHSASAAAVPVIFAGGSSFLRSSAIARIVEFSFDLLKHWPLIGPQAHPGGPTMPDSLNLLHQVIHADHPVASRQLQALYAKDGDGMILANVLPAAATLDLAAKEALAKIFRLCLDDVDATAWQVFTAMKKAIVQIVADDKGGHHELTPEMTSTLLATISRQQKGLQASSATTTATAPEDSTPKAATSAAVAEGTPTVAPVAAEGEGLSMDDSAHHVAVSLLDLVTEMESVILKFPTSFLALLNSNCAIVRWKENSMSPRQQGRSDPNANVPYLFLASKKAPQPMKKEFRALIESTINRLVLGVSDRSLDKALVSIILGEISVLPAVSMLCSLRSAKSSEPSIFLRVAQIMDAETFLANVSSKNPSRVVGELAGRIEQCVAEKNATAAAALLCVLDQVLKGSQRKSKLAEEMRSPPFVNMLCDFVQCPSMVRQLDRGAITAIVHALYFATAAHSAVAEQDRQALEQAQHNNAAAVEDVRAWGGHLGAPAIQHDDDSSSSDDEPPVLVENDAMVDDDDDDEPQHPQGLVLINDAERDDDDEEEEVPEDDEVEDIDYDEEGDDGALLDFDNIAHPFGLAVEGENINLVTPQQQQQQGGGGAELLFARHQEEMDIIRHIMQGAANGGGPHHLDISEALRERFRISTRPGGRPPAQHIPADVFSMHVTQLFRASNRIVTLGPNVAVAGGATNDSSSTQRASLATRRPLSRLGHSFVEPEGRIEIPQSVFEEAATPTPQAARLLAGAVPAVSVGLIQTPVQASVLTHVPSADDQIRNLFSSILPPLAPPPPIVSTPMADPDPVVAPSADAVADQVRALFELGGTTTSGIGTTAGGEQSPPSSLPVLDQLSPIIGDIASVEQQQQQQQAAPTESPPGQVPWEGSLDPAFLAELPQDLRHEVLREHFPILVTPASRQINGVETHFHPLFLAALSSELQDEVLALERTMAPPPQVPAATTADPQTNTPQQGQGPAAAIPMMSEIRLLLAQVGPQLREEILLTCGADELRSDPDLLAEATALRERHQHQVLEARRREAEAAAQAAHAAQADRRRMMDDPFARHFGHRVPSPFSMREFGNGDEDDFVFSRRSRWPPATGPAARKLLPPKAQDVSPTLVSESAATALVRFFGQGVDPMLCQVLCNVCRDSNISRNVINYLLRLCLTPITAESIDLFESSTGSENIAVGDLPPASFVARIVGCIKCLAEKNYWCCLVFCCTPASTGLFDKTIRPLDEPPTAEEVAAVMQNPVVLLVEILRRYDTPEIHRVGTLVLQRINGCMTNLEAADRPRGGPLVRPVAPEDGGFQHVRHAHPLRWADIRVDPRYAGGVYICNVCAVSSTTMCFQCYDCQFDVCQNCYFDTSTDEQHRQRLCRSEYLLLEHTKVLEGVLDLMHHPECTEDTALELVKFFSRGMKAAASDAAPSSATIDQIESALCESATALTIAIRDTLQSARRYAAQFQRMDGVAMAKEIVCDIIARYDLDEAALSRVYVMFLPYAESGRAQPKEVRQMWHASQMYLQDITALIANLSEKNGVPLPSAVLPLVNGFCQFHLIAAGTESFAVVERSETERLLLDGGDTLPSAVSDKAVAVAVSGSSAPPPPTVERLPGAVYRFIEQNRAVVNLLLHWEPRLLDGPFKFISKAPRLVDFDFKLKDFRHRIRTTRGRGSQVTLNVSRQNCLRDSFMQIMQSQQPVLGPFHIRFKDEEGADAGGLTREWFQLLAEEMVNDNYALFVHTSEGNTFQPNPLSDINDKHLDYFKFCGRIVALAVVHDVPIDVHFTRSVYRHLIGVEPCFRDVESIDPTMFTNLEKLIKINLDEQDLGLDFCVSFERFGHTDEVELVPNGSSVPVTNDNKKDYIRRRCAFLMTGQIEAQLVQFLAGFYEVIPRHDITCFTEQEMELVICGMPDIDVEDLRVSTDYSGYSASSPQIRWFWECVAAMTKQDRANLLMFATGASKVPHGGFANLETSGNRQRFTIYKVDTSAELLPLAHTCFNRIDLPEYPSAEVLREKLMLAITYGNKGFTMM